MSIFVKPSLYAAPAVVHVPAAKVDTLSPEVATEKARRDETMMSNEYPLWCIDTHEKTENQYRGPWETREPADAWMVAHADEYAGATIRRCKRISAVGMVSEAPAGGASGGVGSLNTRPERIMVRFDRSFMAIRMDTSVA